MYIFLMFVGNGDFFYHFAKIFVVVFRVCVCVSICIYWGNIYFFVFVFLCDWTFAWLIEMLTFVPKECAIILIIQLLQLNWMEYDHTDNFIFDYEPLGINWLLPLVFSISAW